MRYRTEQIRNVVMLGHGGDGKTTLTESLLFNTGAIDRFGRVEDGNTTTDFDPEEIKRHISISAAIAPVEYNGYKINIIDCPGYFDFYGEVESAANIADGALILLSAVSGMVVGTEKAMDLTRRKNIPRILFVNQMDREHANFEKVLNQLTSKYSTLITAIQYPIMQGEKMIGYVDIIENKAFKFDNKKDVEIPVPADLADIIEEKRNALIEAAAENDEELMEKYFNGEELTVEEISKGIKLGIASASTVPVLCGSAVESWSINCLLNKLVTLLPSPEGRIHTGTDLNGKKVERACKTSEPFSAQVFKTITDPFVGKLSIFKVMSGELKPDASLYNSNLQKSEKISTFYFMKGKKQIQTDYICAGDIGAIAKLAYTQSFHTLCDESNKIIYPIFEMPAPSITLAVYPKERGEEEKVYSGLRRLEEEDPTFKLSKNEETNETLISGLGEIHLDIISKKLKNKFNVEANIVDPKIPYRETIRKTVKAEGKHKKQSGGHGQYGHCWIEFEPITDSEKDFEFVDKIVGGVVPRAYIPAVEKGLLESIKKGVLAGYPMVKIRCTLYDGSYHDVDSSEMAFKIAASLAYKKGCKEANPVILEPIYRIEVTVPDEYMGDIIGDLNKRRGRILGMNPVEEGQQIVAEAPLAEMFKYSTDLRSMTQARGSFTMSFVRYEETPPNIMQKIIEAAQVSEEADA